ncbi:MAG: shikimate kinase, partial [Caulobacteraceae bacterium]
RSISEIFETYGEDAFRSGERRVISRLLDGPPHVLATGGGAFLDPETRALIARKSVSVWLKADLSVLAKRVGRRNHRPLVEGKDPLTVLQAQAAERYPLYGEADIVVETGENRHGVAVQAILEALASRAAERASGQAPHKAMGRTGS